MAADSTPALSPPRAPLVSGGRIAAIIPHDIESVHRLATVVVKSGMAPKSLQTVEQVTVAIMHGMEVGFTPMAALQSIAVVNGMPTIYGDGALALVRGSGLLEDFIEEIEQDEKGPTVATCRAKRVGQATWAQQVFTRAEAQRAGLWGKTGPWTQYPQRMMQMRARSWVLRDAFADVLRGLRFHEEVQDMVDVTAQGSVSTAPPEPRRSDYISDRSSPAQHTPAGGEAGKATGDTSPLSTVVIADSDSQSEAVGGQPALKSWHVKVAEPGQEPKRRAILDLLTLAERWQEVDDIAKEHEEFLGKLGGKTGPDTRMAFWNRKIALGWIPPVS